MEMVWTRGRSIACRQCGVQLKLAECAACGGKGYRRGFLFIKSECETCAGTGRTSCCPNALCLSMAYRRTAARQPLRNQKRPASAVQPSAAVLGAFANSPNNVRSPSSMINPSNPMNGFRPFK